MTLVPWFAYLAAINWDTYWLYLLTEAALSLSPGPAVMLVIAYGLTHGARRSLFAALGVLTANAFTSPCPPPRSVRC